MKQINLNLKNFKRLFLSMIVGVAIVSASCEKEEEPVTPDPMPDPVAKIMEIVDSNDDFSTLATAIDAADLRATLNGVGPFTVFAPTNAAFEQLDTDVLNFLLSNPAELAKVLTYHVVSGKVESKDLSNTNVATLNESLTVAIDISNGVKVNNATVTTADVNADNGIIHIINQVLVPENAMIEDEMKKTITQLAAETESLSTLVSILSLPTLEPLLTAASSTESELTVFAPTNDAFAAVFNALNISDISEIPESVLYNIVAYHIVGSKAMSSDLSNGMYETVNGESVTVDLSNGVMVDNANVSAADIEASNGVVHVIDAVILPSLYNSAVGTVVEVPLFRKEYSMLTEALVTAELVETLLGDGPFTVFAPNNDAFMNAGITSVSGLTKDDLTPILLYHVVGAEVLSSGLPQDGIVGTLNSAGFNEFYLSQGSSVYINGTSMITGVDIVKGNGVIHTIDKTLMPPSQTIVDIAVSLSQATEAEFTTLVALLTDPAQAAVLEAVSDENGSFTLFAPTDAAFAEISSVTSTLSNEQISNVLTYHVIPSRIYSTDLADGINAQTLNGQALGVNINGSTVTISDMDMSNMDATVVNVNINGTNGVIHVIDKVLIPQL